jgi:prenyltransferase beta subunit
VGHFGSAVAALVVCVALPGARVAAQSPASAPAQTQPQAQPPPTTAPTIDAAVQRGIEYLAKHQNGDGSFDAGENKVAVTGLAVMAFLGCGHTPDVGRYGLAVRGGIDFLLSKAQPDGYFGKSHGKGMYDQGIVTLALAEAMGAEVDPARQQKIHAELVKAVKVILDAQAVPKPEAQAGGWRYDRTSADSDLSLSGWNALALRAAQDVGVDVPKEAVQKAVGFVLRCYNAAEKGFSYQPGGNAQIGPTGIGVLSLYLLDAGDRPERQEGAKFITGHAVNDGTPFQYYAMYYVTQAANQAGGAVWVAASKATFDRLLATQGNQGAWPQRGQEPGEVYSTAMAVLTLSVPYRLLPAYQR